MRGVPLLSPARHVTRITGGDDDGAPWDPNLLGPRIWLDAQSDGVTIATAPSTVPDQSGHGNNFAQATAGNRPTKTASIINGHEAYRFTTDDYIATGALVQAQPVTLAIVGRFRDLVANYETLFDLGVAPATAGPQLGIDHPGFGGHLVFYAGSPADGGAVPDANPHCYVCIFDGSMSELWIDGVRFGGNIDSGTDGAQQTRLGGTWDGNLADVDIGEFLEVPGNVGLAGVQHLTAYAAAKWGTPNLFTESPAPVVTAYAAPGGAVGNIYSYAFAASGDVPITWSRTGTLPAGLSLNPSTGELSGTPTTAATYNFTVTATNAAGAATSPNISVVIATATPTAPTITNPTVPNGTVGSFYSKTFAATGSSPITWSVLSGSLPAGLSLNSSTGLLSGTPTTAASYSFVIRATNSTGHNDTGTLGVTIAAAGGRQPLYMWLGIVDYDNLLGGSGGITYNQVMSSGFAGVAISMKIPVPTLPDWFVNFLAAGVAQGEVGVGYDWANGNGDSAGVLHPILPTNSTERANIVACWAELRDKAAAAGCTFWVGDGEPYGFPGGGDNPTDNPWCSNGPLGFTEAMARAFGVALAPVLLSLGDGILYGYTSSNASWPGSSQAQISPAGHFDTNMFGYFIEELVDAGVRFILSDASFHWGVQNPAAGGDYETAIDIVIAGVQDRFGPTAGGNIMNWPDNSEGHGFFDPGSVASIVEVATRVGDGGAFVYEQQLTSGEQVAYWNAVLSAINSLGLPR